MMRCRTGTFTHSEFGTAPDQRRTTPLRFVLRRIRGTLGYGSALRCLIGRPGAIACAAATMALASMP
jgi:hypothetical protein